MSGVGGVGKRHVVQETEAAEGAHLGGAVGRGAGEAAAGGASRARHRDRPKSLDMGSLSLQADLEARLSAKPSAAAHAKPLATGKAGKTAGPAAASASADAAPVTAALKRGDTATAVKSAVDVGRRLLRAPQDAAARQRFQGMLGALAAKGKLGDLKKAVEAEEDHMIERRGEFPEADQPYDKLDWLVRQGATEDQKAIWNSTTSLPPSARDVKWIEAALAKGKFATAAANALTYGTGFDPPLAGSVERFKGMLDGLEKDGKLGDVRRAFDATEAAGEDFGGGIDWQGPVKEMAKLVERFGTQRQKATWKAAANP